MEQALTIISWMQNLPEDEIPPEHLWEDTEGLELWWKAVDVKRKDGASISRGPTDHAQDDQGPQQTENDYARFLKRG